MLRPLLAGLIVAGAFAHAAASQILTAAPTYDAALGKLTATEVQASFSGKHEENGVDVKGHYWTIHVMADGGVTFATSTYADQGRVAIRGNAVCFAWEKAWKGEEQCFHFAHHGREYASYGPDGSLNSTLTVSR